MVVDVVIYHELLDLDLMTENEIHVVVLMAEKEQFVVRQEKTQK